MIDYGWTDSVKDRVWGNIEPAFIDVRAQVISQIEEVLLFRSSQQHFGTQVWTEIRDRVWGCE